MAVAHHQQFAVEHGIEAEMIDEFREGLADVVARAGEEPRRAALGGDLDADAVPFPFGGERPRAASPPTRRPPADGPASAGGRRGWRKARGARRSAPASRKSSVYGGEKPCQSSSISSTCLPKASATACLASRAETPTRGAPLRNLSSAQRPVASRRSSHWVSNAAWPPRPAFERAATISERRGASPCAFRHRPDQRHGFRRVAHVIARHAEEFGVEAAFADLRQHAAQREVDGQAIRQRCQREAPVGVRRRRGSSSASASAWRCAPACR